MKLEIIMFNMSNWREWEKGVVNRNRHIFFALRKNPNVSRLIAIDFLPFTFKRAVRNYYEGIFNGLEGETIYRDLTNQVKKLKKEEGLAETYVFSSIDSLFSPQRFLDKLIQVLKKINQSGNQSEPTRKIIWSYFPMFVEYFDKIKADLTVFDTVDNWLEHPSWVKQKKRLEENYKIIAQKSNLIFTVAQDLANFFKKSFEREKDVYVIENGVDFFHLTKEIKYADKKLEKIKRPIVGYIGTLEKRVDADLLAYLARENQDKSFVLIGPLWPAFAEEAKKFRKFKNIYLFGRRSYELSPYYMQNFDVAIIPHKLTKFMKSTSSLKLLEYLSCGKPVVSVPISGAEKIGHLVFLATDYAEFNKRINQALLENNEELKRKREKYAAACSWEKKVAEMLRIINYQLSIFK